MENKIEVNRPNPTFNRVGVLAVLILVAVVIIALLFGQLQEQKAILEAMQPEYNTRNQVVLTGLRNDIDILVVNVANTLNISLTEVVAETQVEFISFPGLDNNVSQLQAEPISQASSIQRDPDQPVVAVYNILDSREEPVTVAEVVQTIRNQAQESGFAVFSDPNYIIGRSPLDPRDHRRINGDPDSSEGYALTETAGVSTAVQFYTQWAFQPPNMPISERVGIELFTNDVSSADERPQSAVEYTGEGVIVAVFDTSPFDLPGVQVTFDEMMLDVYHHEGKGIPDMRDHGLFVASLVHAVAPSSTIQLYRVLNESNVGDLGTLLRALDTFIEDRKNAPDADPVRPLSGTVINLSLGVHLDPESDLPTDERGQVVTLFQTLQRASGYGAVIVAASGNDSAQLYRENKEPRSMQIPAEYGFVIGVGASNYQGELSCFSNKADVYAPGGDNNRINCRSVVRQCPLDPSNCIIGSALHTSSDTHYAYWAGTSFAAPLVSGQAALLLEEDISPAVIKTKIISSGIPMNGRVSGRIINIPASLTP